MNNYPTKEELKGMAPADICFSFIFSAPKIAVVSIFDRLHRTKLDNESYSLIDKKVIRILDKRISLEVTTPLRQLLYRT